MIEILISIWSFMIMVVFVLFVYLRHIDRTIQAFLDYWCDISLKIGILEQQLEELTK